MNDVVVTGQLICANDGEASIVRQHLPLHIQNTRIERGYSTG